MMIILLVVTFMALYSYKFQTNYFRWEYWNSQYIGWVYMHCNLDILFIKFVCKSGPYVQNPDFFEQ